MTIQAIFILIIFGALIIGVVSNAITDKKKKKEQEALNENKQIT